MKMAIRSLMDYKTSFKGKESKRTLSIPFLFGIQSKRGEATVTTETKIPDQDASIKTNLGVYREERDSFGYFKKEYYRLSMFAGTHQILTKKEPDESLTIQKRISGNYKYFYHNGSLGLGDLESEIYKLANLTGFKNELLKIKIKVPGYNMEKYLTSKEKMVSFKGLYRKENMGTGKLSLDLMLGMKELMIS